MLLLPEILTWFFSKIVSLVGDFLLILEPPFQFFHRFLELHLLLSLRSSTSGFPLPCFGALLYLYILVLDTSPGLSS